MRLNYDFQYDIAAICVLIVFLFIIYLRKPYKSRSTNIFINLIVCDLVAAILDIVSCYTITYPASVPLWVNYVVSLGYLFFYNWLSILFLIYVDSKAKIKKAKKPIALFSTTVMTIYLVLMATSPFTHLVAYFDENLVYQHGPVFDMLFAMPFVVFAIEIVLFFVARKQFNSYQIYASVSLILAMSGAVGVSILIPRALVGPLFISAILFFVYVAYENPAHYTYKDTSCLNRRAFISTVRKNKMENHPFGIVAFAIQDYDYIRHNHGIDTMEKATSKVAEFMHRQFKHNAYVLSDDRYAVLTFSQKEALMAKQIISEYFITPLTVEEDVFNLTISLVEIEKLNLNFDLDEIESLVDYYIQNPDKEFTAEEMVDAIINQKQHREQLLHVIKRALDQDEFQIFYQPIYDVETGKFHSAEALIRLIDPELGFINPEELITLAEENGYIKQIGELVFRKVCSFMRDSRMRELGIDYVEINLSPKQCMDPTLAAVFQSVMRIYKIDPNWVNLEITETAQTTGNRYWLDNVEYLNKLGVEFSIDDFGSGFASADYLIKIPVTIVKIDKVILWNAMKDEQAMIVLTNTIRMLKHLGKKVVVEGVEDEEMVRILKENQVDYLQGYYFSKPVPQREFLDFLKQNNSQVNL